MNPAADTPPDRFGPYEVFERLGVGGMATVHRAKKRGPEGFERAVALKRMLANLADDPTFVESFVREAKVASLLVHPNIAQVYDFGRIAGIYYIAMELVQGLDVRRLLRYASRANEAIPLPVILSILAELCEALDFAHNFHDEHGAALNIVHRDISPSNLIVAHTGHVKVIDFGIAKANSRQLHTESGMIKGKLGYMSPEVVYGLPVGPGSDMFSVGVVAWELITASPLFTTRTDFETMRRVREADIVPPSLRNAQCPEDLDQLILATLEREPERRLTSAHEFRAALDDIAARARVPISARAVVEWMLRFAGPDDAWARSSQPPRKRSTSTAPPPIGGRPTGSTPRPASQLSTQPPTTNIRIGRSSSEIRPSRDAALYRSAEEERLAAEVWGEDAPPPGAAGPDFSFADEQRVETQSLVASSQLIDRHSQQPVHRATPLPMPSQPAQALAMPLPAPPHTQVAPQPHYAPPQPYAHTPAPIPSLAQHHGSQPVIYPHTPSVPQLPMLVHTPASGMPTTTGMMDPRSVILLPPQAPPQKKSKALFFVVLGLAGVAAAMTTYLLIKPSSDEPEKTAMSRTPDAAAPAGATDKQGDPTAEKPPEPPPEKPPEKPPVIDSPPDKPPERIATLPDKPQKPPDKPVVEKPKKPAEKPQKPPDKPQKLPEQPDPPTTNVTVEKPDKPEKPELVPDKPERPEKPEKPQKPEKPPVVERPPEKPARTPVVAPTAVTKLSGEVPTVRGKSDNPDVMVKMCIDERGAVTSVSVVKAPDIAAELQRGLASWRYRPWLNKDGKPSPVCFPLSLRVVNR